MCGIVGILGREAVAGQLVDALKRLEYRGYDSAGVATLEGGKLSRRRAEGKLKNLESRLRDEPLAGTIGIGHTRWATHGRPTENNAHPHATEQVAVVHNGIIENYRELRAQLEKSGAKFVTQTDTEVVAHLVSREMKKGLSPSEAVAAALPQLRGAFALAFLFAGKDDLLIGARKGSPLAVGYGDGEMYLGSDAIALAPFTDTICYLEDGDWVELSRKSAAVRDASGRAVQRQVLKSSASSVLIDKGNHRHFMAKEIHEQPEVVGHTLAHYLDMAAERVRMPELPFDFAKIDRITISACGTAYYAGLTAKYWFERFARLPVEIDVASEFRYREAPFSPGGLAIFVSQSGETADTLATLRYAKEQQQHVLSVVNVQTSTIARESDVVMPTLAGPEIGVASTKAFTCQLAVLACLAIHAGRARGVLSQDEERRLVRALIEVPRLMAEALVMEPRIVELARDLAKSRDVLYLGRGTSYPLALEGALKLKEISYIHAEGYAAGELKHGPIALIDETMPVIVIAPFDRVFEKTVSNMQEVA
ncbi:MAG TPA: glutamine--fructose-6-phosphate transaminase (isomerizing), partial [Xanthobacteraceae bacterium]|nr:glutamine--fructose-6-phosphate transaminase (isomerizing) [Xanthobacteraceae bacterium]